MADFELRVLPGAGEAGPLLRRWVDPPSATGAPSRIRPRAGREQLYWWAKVGVPIVLKATVGGVEGPLDSALGGRLFHPFLVEGFGPPLFIAAAGLTSCITWQPMNGGHHVVGVRRDQGGAYLVHFDIED